MITTHELALAASINLENMLLGFDSWQSMVLVLDTLNEIAGRLD